MISLGPALRCRPTPTPAPTPSLAPAAPRAPAWQTVPLGLDHPRPHTRLQRLHIQLHPMKTLGQRLDRSSHRRQQLPRVRVAQRGAPDVLRAHRALPADQPLRVDVQRVAHRGQKLDARRLPLHVAPDRLGVDAGKRTERTIRASTRRRRHAFVKALHPPSVACVARVFKGASQPAQGCAIWHRVVSRDVNNPQSRAMHLHQTRAS